MSPELEEICDLVVEGRCREAYEKARDYYPDMMSWDARARLIAARKAPQARPFPTEAEIDARHDRERFGLEENKAKRTFETLNSMYPAEGGKPDRASRVVARPAGGPAAETAAVRPVRQNP
ncbi:hypothetical protein [Mesorhizobium opportunistum]|uniref:Translation initiation factor IF-2 n=1 Tax=Mesorhizobium opportunistum (strain LMG 24607 / HAMBI 3007 / WSM2075) TaxID=536019 RepID=F7XZU4_MESOW|nr:hypothetical protein [Mesorhizobium opportunistum]AEH88158.1 translation initiation factor IF-2 [Mesorhizobium opportunistum WSM2075]